MRVAAYRRVSSDEQIDGYSLDAQSRAIRTHCDSHGWQIVHEYGDEGKSAWTDDITSPRSRTGLVRSPSQMMLSSAPLLTIESRRRQAIIPTARDTSLRRGSPA